MNRQLRRVRRAFRWYEAVTRYPKAMQHAISLRSCERSVRLAEREEDETAHHWFRHIQGGHAQELELYVELDLAH